MKAITIILLVMICISLYAQNPDLKFTQNMDLSWAKSEGNGTPVITDMVVAKDKSTYLTGYFTDKVKIGKDKLTSAGGKDIFVAKYNKKGDFEWASQAGGIYDDVANSICLGFKGKISLTGYFTESAKFGDLTLGAMAGYSSLFVNDIDAKGNWAMVRGYGVAGEAIGMHISSDKSGTLNVLAITSGELMGMKPEEKKGPDTIQLVFKVLNKK